MRLPDRPARTTMTAAAALTVASTLLAGGCARSPAARPPASGPARQPTGSALPARLPTGSALLATLSGAVPRFASPGRTAAGRVPATWYGARSVLPVVATRPGWVRVRLAQRPNGSTAWLPARDVKLSSTPYRIVIDLATTRLTLYRAGRKVFVTPPAWARSRIPRRRAFFVAFLEEPAKSDPGYGAIIMVTSAHSDAISGWHGSGDAAIGIHGPLGSGKVIDQPARISRTAASGCLSRS